jgi:uncharacterized protein YutE (UPF0331/DUF86 family)
MSDDRWLKVDETVASALRHFGNSVKLFEVGNFEGEEFETYRDRMAFLHMMEAGYTSLEACLERIMTLFGEIIPTGSDSHAAILASIAAPVSGRRAAIVEKGGDLSEAMDEARRFRHVARHRYDDIEVDRVEPAKKAAETICQEFGASIEAFKRRSILPERPVE